MQSNLWRETMNVLDYYNKTWDDVMFVCGNDFEVSKDNFKTIAKKTNYDFGFGKQEVARDLKIVGKDFWLERDEYDGAEAWEYKTLPSKPDAIKQITSVIGCWDTLATIKYGVDYDAECSNLF